METDPITLWMDFVLKAGLPQRIAPETANFLADHIQSPQALYIILSKMNQQQQQQLTKLLIPSETSRIILMSYLSHYVQNKDTMQLEASQRLTIQSQHKQDTSERESKIQLEESKSHSSSKAESLFSRVDQLSNVKVRAALNKVKKSWLENTQIGLLSELNKCQIESQSQELDILVKLLSLEEVKITKLSLNRNNLGNRGCELLSKALASNRNLTEFNFCGNAFTDIGCRHISRALVSNCVLTHLNISSNQIGDPESEYIANALLNNRTLVLLNLSSNKIGDIGSRFFSHTLLSNNTLMYLDLSSNRIGNDGCRSLVACINQPFNLNLKYNSISYSKSSFGVASNFTLHL